MKANLLRRVLVAKATVFVGLTMMVAVMLGAASTAQAHVGDVLVFHLNHSNSVSNVFTKLVGSIAGPILTIDNNSVGFGATALDLQVEPGKPPMKVNSSAKVTNLNADLLDGKDSSAFLGRTEKAADADRLDGKDSTQFLSAVPYENSRVVAVPAGANNQSIFVKCDPGDVALSGGADNIEPPTELNEVSRLIGTSDTWEVEVSRPLTQGGDPLAEDPQGVLAEVYCWDRPPLRP
jgi:hypothetical protein